ncbi:biorientation of chromosomes in cell division protein 1-like 1 [Dreissena polymorpha]|uniref:biorientation of chromosomes in cell division protein 1-like 1 n=1 Tax=Dreissena polymorpha TaxID=45954 RepID=UPI002263D09D|nr:biorientation of chromosomes in cell division protein 1-like 1 [Dreissena polymorpha]
MLQLKDGIAVKWNIGIFKLKGENTNMQDPAIQPLELVDKLSTTVDRGNIPPEGSYSQLNKDVTDGIPTGKYNIQENEDLRHKGNLQSYSEKEIEDKCVQVLTTQEGNSQLGEGNRAALQDSSMIKDNVHNKVKPETENVEKSDFKDDEEIERKCVQVLTTQEGNPQLGEGNRSALQDSSMLKDSVHTKVKPETENVEKSDFKDDEEIKGKGVQVLTTQEGNSQIGEGNKAALQKSSLLKDNVHNKVKSETESVEKSDVKDDEETEGKGVQVLTTQEGNSQLGERNRAALQDSSMLEDNEHNKVKPDTENVEKSDFKDDEETEGKGVQVLTTQAGNSQLGEGNKAALQDSSLLKDNVHNKVKPETENIEKSDFKDDEKIEGKGVQVLTTQEGNSQLGEGNRAALQDSSMLKDNVHNKVKPETENVAKSDFKDDEKIDGKGVQVLTTQEGNSQLGEGNRAALQDSSMLKDNVHNKVKPETENVEKSDFKDDEEIEGKVVQALTTQEGNSQLGEGNRAALQDSSMLKDNVHNKVKPETENVDKSDFKNDEDKSPKQGIPELNKAINPEVTGRLQDQESKQVDNFNKLQEDDSRLSGEITCTKQSKADITENVTNNGTKQSAKVKKKDSKKDKDMTSERSSSKPQTRQTHYKPLNKKI